MVGHCLSGAGSVERSNNFTVVPWFCFSNINCEDLHPEITALIDESKIPRAGIEMDLNIAKS
jgi:hypothetical protein